MDQLATISGINRATIHRIELDQVSPRLDTLDMLCRALGMSLQGFFQAIPNDTELVTAFRESHSESQDPEAVGTTIIEEERNPDTAGIRKGVLEWLEHVEALIHHSVDPLMVLDREGLILYASPAAVRMLGSGPNERRCKSWFECVHPEEKNVLESALRTLLERPQEHVSVAYRVRYQDESWRWARSNCSNQLDHPSIQGILVNTQDITQHKQLEMDLKTSEGRLRAILDAIPDMLLLIRKDGTVLTYKAPQYQNVIADMAHRIGQNIKDLPLPPDYKDIILTMLDRAIKTGEIQESSCSIEVEGKVRIRELRIHRSSPSEALILVRDITQQREAEEQLWQAQKLECLGVIAGGVAHQFNNILMGIQGSLEASLRHVPKESRAQHHLKVIQDFLKRAAHTTNQLRDFAGHPILFPETIDLNQLVQDVLKADTTLLPSHHRLCLKLKEGLPLVEADPKPIRRVIHNLLANACESMGPNTGTITIQSGTEFLDAEALEHRFADQNIEQPGEFVWLSVQDTGCGIDEKTLERIFDPFFTTKFAGRGLGLPAAQGLIREHRGGIKVESHFGKGSRFSIYLPLSTGRHSTIQPQEISTKDGSKRRKILVAEDEDLLRMCLSDVISRMGYHPIETQNGAEAVEAFRANADEIALVLLDINMPVMDGREAFHAIRKLDPHVKVALSTGSCEDTFGNAPETRHLAAVLRKPYSTNDLREMLQRIL